MRKNYYLLAVGVLLLLSAALPLLAQQSAVSKVMTIEREEIKPGSQMVHAKEAKGFADIFSKAKSTAYWLGLDPISGNENMALFLIGYDSFEAIEKGYQKMAGHGAEFEKLDREAGGVHTRQTTVICALRPDLSYRLEDVTMKNLAKTHYINMETFRLRPGSEFQFMADSKTYFEALAKAGITRPVVTYQVVAGTPNGTYLIFEGYESMKDLDANTEKAFMEAMGLENLKKMAASEREYFESSEGQLFAVNPEMSYVSKEFAAEDPAFWSPKPPAKPKAAPPAAKETKKQ